jgi:hypothetical protein
VADDGTVRGWERPDRVDLQSHLGSILRREIDPLPPFVCGIREVDGKPIAVVRVFPSVDAPHIVRGTGAVYVRSSRGKEPVDDHRTLLDLVRRGEEAERRARERLVELPVVGQLLRTPDSQWRDPLMGENQRGVRYVARAAPLTVTPALTEWPLTRTAAEECMRLAEELLPRPPRLPAGFQNREGPYIEPYGRAVAVRLAQGQVRDQTDRVTIIADSGGAVAVELVRGSFGDEASTVLLNQMLDGEIRPMAKTLATLLQTSEAFGRALVDLWVLLAPGDEIRDRRRDPLSQLFASGELTIPAGDDEVHALAERWHRELQRHVGITKFEGGPDV